jgi:hypothetical protein
LGRGGTRIALLFRRDEAVAIQTDPSEHVVCAATE